MSVPKSVVKIKKGNVEYTSRVDFAAYTIVELSRAAMRDVGKYVTRKVNSKAMRLRGMVSKKNRPSAGFAGINNRVKGRTSTFLYDVPWAKSGLPHLELGITDEAWYGVDQELGKSGMPKLGLLRNTTYEQIAKIVEIESKYLSALEDEARALALIDEGEYKGGADD